jgi:hypothetical protein
MRPERELSERNGAVREAAREWSRAGAISGAVLQKIEREYPDDRVRLAPIWRVTVFAGILFALLSAAVGLAVAVKLGESMIGPLCLLLGIFCVVLTEIQQRRFRMASTGSDAATSLLSIAFLLVAWGRWLESGVAVSARGTQTMLWLAAFLLFGLSAWRWGFALYGFASTASLIFLAGRLFPGPRLGWSAAACLVLALAAPNIDRPWLAPSHRDALAAALAAALLSLYAVLNPWSIESGSIERFSGRSPVPPEIGQRANGLSASATALFVLLVLVWGIRKRRRLVLDLGGAFVVLSLVTLRHYVHFAPLWVILSASGAAAVAAASGFERFLRRRPDGRAGGFTSRPLFGEERFLSDLSVVAAAATLSPGPAGGMARSSKTFDGGGGGFGGGGVSAGF